MKCENCGRADCAQMLELYRRIARERSIEFFHHIADVADAIEDEEAEVRIYSEMLGVTLGLVRVLVLEAEDINPSIAEAAAAREWLKQSRHAEEKDAEAEPFTALKAN